MPNHITDPKPGEIIEVSNGDPSDPACNWSRAIVVGKAPSGCWVIVGPYGLDYLDNWSHSRRPPQKKLVKWNAETFAAHWDDQFRFPNNLDASKVIRVTMYSETGVTFAGTYLTYADLLKIAEHRPSPSSPWQPCGVEVEA